MTKQRASAKDDERIVFADCASQNTHAAASAGAGHVSQPPGGPEMVHGCDAELIRRSGQFGLRFTVRSSGSDAGDAGAAPPRG